ncbi:hypothetical protein N7453_002186 [Penicillium expansum]|nr:hypothetical protein N7453_002186 [Penicillium expansum]
MACCDCKHTLSSSERDDELSDPKMLPLPGDKTSEEASLEREGCIRNLQVFRYNLYQKESKVHDCDAFADLLYYEEELRRNCQAEISLRRKVKNYPSVWSLWGTGSPSFEGEMSTLYQDNWMRTRAWWTASLEAGVVVVIVDVVLMLNVQIVQPGRLVWDTAL